MQYEMKDFKKDLTDQANSLGKRERQEFLARLAAYQTEMDVGQDDKQAGDLMNSLTEWLKEYFMPLDKEGKLDKPLWEQRMGDFCDFLADRQIEAGKELEKLDRQEPHSGEWKQNWLLDHMKNPADVRAMSCLSSILGTGARADACKEAYGGAPMDEVLSEQVRAGIQRKMQDATFDDRRALSKGQRLFQAAAVQNNAREEEIKKNEVPYGNPDHYEMGIREYGAQLDFSFIRSSNVARTLRRSQRETRKSPLCQLSDQLGEIEEALNSRENSRWRGDSGYMKDVKNKLKNLRELIEIQGSGTREKRAEIGMAYRELQDSCGVYLEHRSGTRMSPAGARRQEQVNRLSNLLGKVQPVMWEIEKKDNQEMRAEREAAEAAKRSSLPGRQMANLLVMAETGASFQEVYAEKGFKEQKEAAFARIQKAMLDREAMTEIVGKCSKAMASIDLRKETLKYIGADPDTLTQGQMEIALKAPANANKINYFLTYMSDSVKKASREMNGPFLKDVRSQMAQDGKWKNTLENGQAAAKAITEHLEAEVQWSKMRKDYENGYEHEDRNAGISYLTSEQREAHRQALNLGRQKLAMGELKWEKKAEVERMDFNALNREFQNEQARPGRRRSNSLSVSRPEMEHAAPSRDRHAMGR